MWGRQIVGTLVAVNGGKAKLGEPIRIKHKDRGEIEEQQAKPAPRAKPVGEDKKPTSDPSRLAAFFNRL